MTCTALRHDTAYANIRYGCVCPEALTARRRNRPEKVRGRSGPGRRTPGRPDDRTVAERMTSVALLTRAGESAASIATRLGIAERSVARYRARLREEAA